MSKTWLSIVTAVTLSLIAVAVFIARRSVLGPETAGPLGWNVTLHVEGTLQSKDASVSVVRPLDFRRQHISEERFVAGNELREPTKRSGERRHVWRRQLNAGEPAPFRLEYAFRCSRQRPTTAMERQSQQSDAAPTRAELLESTPRIQAKDEQIGRVAAAHAGDDALPRDQAQALFDFVAQLADLPVDGAATALDCLKNGGGDALAKARLLTALCRNRGLPARLVTGLVLRTGGPLQPHYWVEAWLADGWLPMDPTRRHFGAETLPENYLVLRFGDAPLVAAKGARVHYSFAVETEHYAGADSDDQYAPSRAKELWRTLSFHSLHVSEQQLVKFLLLLPLAALIVSIARTLIGIRTFGVFAPALIGLAFLDLKALPWGLPIFLLTVLVGWGIRHVLEHYHLLQVPRVAVMITLIVIFLLAVVLIANNLGVTTTRYISLFPLVILTFLVERFWTIEVEDSVGASFTTLLGTIGVAVVVSVALGHQAIGAWLLRYPETLGLVLAAQFLLGRYTGYRLTELYRFEDLIKEESAVGGNDELADALAAPAGARHHGHEPPQRPVHSGPQSAPPLSAGRYQEPAARAVPADRRADA